jgi:thiamine pyrophosphate-dependent acetolactate synthase large subunit-like protein
METMKVDRRKFLAGVAGAGAASTVAAPHSAAAAPAVKFPSAAAHAAETLVPAALPASPGRPGSDFMVDVIRSLGIEYIAANPASSFRGLQESIVNYGGNAKPEFLTCMHEESSVGMAHGYFKIAGKPMGVLCHGTVGLQHASMALYNAWCDRVPVITILGNIVDATKRRPGVEWLHTAQDVAAIVRDFTKWDDLPGSLQHFAESTVRAYKIAMTPPMEPVGIVADGGLQEGPINDGESLTIPRLVPTAPPQGDAGAVREAARLLANAEAPVIVADRLARTAQGIKLLVELAETLNAPVIDQRGRMNFPTAHYLCHSERGRALIGQADVILGLELTDYWGTVNAYADNHERTTTARTKAGVKLISIGVGDLYTKSNYQDFERFAAVDVPIAGDGEATLPALIEAVKAALSSERRAAIAGRADAMRKAHAAMRERQRMDATYAWDASPVSTARLSAELWGAIRNEDWSLVSPDNFISGWPHRLWNMEKHHHFIGGSGGAGVGYCMPAAVGAALANRAQGRISININGDGDIMYAPGVLWTAVHHKIPLLTLMHNNRAYHQEFMHLQRMANRRNRGVDRAHIGTRIEEPFIAYAKLAQSMGMWAEGPIENPADLGPAIKRALAVVKGGEPALLDVVMQPR